MLINNNRNNSCHYSNRNSNTNEKEIEGENNYARNIHEKIIKK